jgi:hypothetical protein
VLLELWCFGSHGEVRAVAQVQGVGFFFFFFFF